MNATNLWTAEKIKKLRQRYGEKQDEFCKRLGVSCPALRHWEQGLGRPNGSAQVILNQLARRAA